MDRQLTLYLDFQKAFDKVPHQRLLERLQQCRLTTPEIRRIRGDQMEVFKIMHGYERLNKDMFFKIKNDSITIGNSLALVKCHPRLDIRKYAFSQRAVNDWNRLPEE